MIKISMQGLKGKSSFLISITDAVKNNVVTYLPEIFLREESFFELHYKIYNKYPSIPL